MLALEVIPISVTDVDRALDFYSRKVGFPVDVDYRPNASFHVIQLTPAGSSCSIHLVKAKAAERIKGLYLVTDDIVRERERLIAAGVSVAPIRRKDDIATWAGGFADGIDPERRNYASFASFEDPDGNEWVLQERGYEASKVGASAK